MLSLQLKSNHKIKPYFFRIIFSSSFISFKKVFGSSDIASKEDASPWLGMSRIKVLCSSLWILNNKLFHQYPLHSPQQPYELERLSKVPDLLFLFFHSQLKHYLKLPFSSNVIISDKRHLQNLFSLEISLFRFRSLL